MMMSVWFQYAANRLNRRTEMSSHGPAPSAPFQAARPPDWGLGTDDDD
jgi:hypothetical protein